MYTRYVHAACAAYVRLRDSYNGCYVRDTRLQQQAWLALGGCLGIRRATMIGAARGALLTCRVPSLDRLCGPSQNGYGLIIASVHVIVPAPCRQARARALACLLARPICVRTAVHC